MKPYLVAGGVVLGLAGGVVAARSVGGSAATPPPASAAAAPVSASLVVGPGRVEPVSEEIEISAEMPGRLERVMVDEGDRVQAGAMLAEIAHADYDAQLASARARLASARAELRRIVNGARVEEREEARAAAAQGHAVLEQAATERDRRASLFHQGVIPREELERSERDLRVARARHDELHEHHRVVDAAAREEDVARAEAAVALAAAQIREAEALIEKARVRAPSDGLILRRHLQTGESVAVSPVPTPILTMADVSRLRVRVDVDETDIGGLAVGQTAWVTADAYGSQRFPGRVVRVGAMLGRKNIRTDEPAERVDNKIRETLIELDRGVDLPVGLRVDAFIERTPGGR